ncbi:hypothetical protein HDU86_007578 [Geranomyces michiganensis]|nr:hypothetical protein HDU86_007578 [Geranomyces michiganensis]
MTQDDQVKRWNDWKIEYNKVYSTPEKEAAAFEIWKVKDAEIIQLNADPTKYLVTDQKNPFGHTALSDIVKPEWNPITIGPNFYVAPPHHGPRYIVPSAEERRKLNSVIPPKPTKP